MQLWQYGSQERHPKPFWRTATAWRQPLDRPHPHLPTLCELGEGLKKLEGRYDAIGMDICRQARTMRRRGYTRALERRTKLSGVKVLRDQEQHVVQREVSKPLQWLEDSVQEGRHAVVKKGGQAGSKD
jgi:hypothetical protein